jgi:hypothetical protein
VVPGLSPDCLTCQSWEQGGFQAACKLDFPYNRGISEASALVIHIRGQVHEIDSSNTRQETPGSVEGGSEFCVSDVDRLFLSHAKVGSPV